MGKIGILMKANEIKSKEMEKIKSNFTGSRYIFERKYDGSRHLIMLTGTTHLITSEREVVKNDHFPHLIDLFKDIGGEHILDCEIYIEGGTVLDLAKKVNWDKARCCVFDIIKYNGEDVTMKPFKERKELIKILLKDVFNDYVHMPVSFEDYDEAWKYVNNNKLEGLMMKDLEAFYYKGKRTDAWRKIKRKECMDIQIIGWENGSTKGTFICKTKDGVECRVSGTSVDIVNYWKANKPWGMEISYMFLTESGKPFQPVFNKFVEVENEN